jgi:hypothetical protein
MCKHLELTTIDDKLPYDIIPPSGLPIDSLRKDVLLV